MRKNIRLWTLICLVGWVITATAAIFALTLAGSQDYTYIIKIVILGYGLTCILLMLVGVTGLYFMDRLKQVSLIGWRLFIFSFVVFSVLVLPRIGNSLVVADEGWSSLYKHPLVWILLALLAGDVILYLFKNRNSTKVS